MIISAVVAVALGVAPVKDGASAQFIAVDEATIARQIGRYETYISKDGLTHVRGFDRQGRAYDLSIDSKGHVEGSAGNWDVSFDVTQ